MSNFSKRILAVLVSVCLLVPCVPVVADVPETAPATEKFEIAERKLDLKTVPEVIGTELATERKHLERRYDKEESLYNVVFENADGTETLYLFDYPVKYETESGEVKDIKLDIKQDAKKPGTFVAADHKVQTTFSKELLDGIKLKDEEVSVTLQPKLPTANVKNDAKIGATVSAEDFTAKLIDEKTVLYRYDDKTSLEYSLTYTGFKEDIVVSEYTGQTEYEFTLLTEGLKLEQTDGSYYLTDENGEIKATLGDIIIFTADERNNAFGRMTHETIRENQEYKLTIHVDADYLRDEATVYPIRIDPTIEINYDNNGTGGIEDVTINSTAGSSGTSGSLFVGKRANYGISRTLMRFPELVISSIPSAESITSASVEIRDIMCEADVLTVYCHVYTGTAWSESTANWSSVSPDSYVSTALSSNSVSYSNGVNKATKHRYSFDITSAVKGWKIGNYLQSKGLIFKASSSVENGSTNISKTFASYNRSSNKPSLTITYSDTTSQFMADGIYYINNVSAGKYIRYNSVSITGESGLISSLGTSIEWKVQKVESGYIMRSTTDTTKYLGVPASGGGSNTQIYTISNSEIPRWCIWDISNSGNGGYYIKDTYGKYLYVNGSNISTTSTLGTYGSDEHGLRVWRVADVSYMDGKELTADSYFSTMILSVGETATPTINKNPTTALWSTLKDFDFSYKTGTDVSISSTGVITANAEGITTVIAIHKVTGQKYVFAIIIGNTPIYRLRHYIDQGYSIRFGDNTSISTYHNVVVEKFSQIFGMRLYASNINHTSAADICKINQFGSVTSDNLTESCTHNPTHLTRTALINVMGNGTPLISNVLWTGHILEGNLASASFFDLHVVVMTPRDAVVESNGYRNKSEELRRYAYTYTLMHELSHQLGVPDHYCREDNGDGQCSNESCDMCYNGMADARECIMSRWYNVETKNIADLYCEECLETITNHLKDHQ